MDTCNKEDILRRIKEFREYTNMSKATLAASIGMEQTTLNNQFLGKRGVSLDLIIGILKAFDEVSAEWLFRDKGDMFIVNYQSTEQKDENKHIERIENLVGAIATLQETINEKTRTIQLCEDENRRLKGELAMIKNERNIG